MASRSTELSRKNSKSRSGLQQDASIAVSIGGGCTAIFPQKKPSDHQKYQLFVDIATIGKTRQKNLVFGIFTTHPNHWLNTFAEKRWNLAVFDNTRERGSKKEHLQPVHLEVRTFVMFSVFGTDPSAYYGYLGKRGPINMGHFSADEPYSIAPPARNRVAAWTG